MDRHLRPRKREREIITGFLPSEVEKMDNALSILGDEVLDEHYCKKTMARFNCSKDRAGKPALRWTEVLNWFSDRLQSSTNEGTSLPNPPKKACPVTKTQDNFEGNEKNQVPEVSELAFEAKSSKDSAWYDVDAFLAHRLLESGEVEARVRFANFGFEDDEWVCVKSAVRERSVPLEHWECEKVEVGNVLLCFQKRKHQARYYDARVENIERRQHDGRGCRCRFSIRYDHDNTQETVGLRSLCRRRWSAK